MKTFDRYLLTRYMHVVAVFMIATIGLYAVVDGFMNLDEFQRAADTIGTPLFMLMGKHYLFHAALLAELAGPTIMVIGAMCALALMLKQGEIHPLLAAGVPTYRLTASLLFGLLFFNGLLILNQELVLPQIAHHLQGSRGDGAENAQQVVPMLDPLSNIYINGTGVVTAQDRLDGPEFSLPSPALTDDMVVLKGDHATYHLSYDEEPSGWLIKNVVPPIDTIPLTEQGRNMVIPQPGGNDVFVASSVTADHLSLKSANQSLIAVSELFRQLQQPVGSQYSRRSLLVHVHQRLTRPILSLIGLYLVIPLIIRRERMSPMQQVTNIAACSLVLGLVFGTTIGTQYLGVAGILKPEQAVWTPLIAGGGLAAWLTGTVRT